MTGTVAWCSVCRRPRDPLTEVLVVTEIATGRERFVCRPSEQGRCFENGVRSIAWDAIRAPQPPPADPAIATPAGDRTS
jgi:hypothetical protein